MFQGWEKVDKAQVLSLLKQLEELFKEKEKWIDWPLSEDEKGIDIKPDDPKAAKFNLMGASELFTSKEYEKPLCDFIDCATREYLNELSGEDLIHGRLDYEHEMLLLRMAIEELEKNV